MSQPEKTDTPTSKSKTLVTPPESLYDMMLELSLNYTIERPTRFNVFAANYFKGVRDLIAALRINEEMDTSTIDEIVSTIPSSVSSESQYVHRKSIMADHFDEWNPPLLRQPLFIPKITRVRSFLTKTVKECFLFNALDRPLLYDIISSMEEEIIKGGYLLVRQGELTDKMYVLEKGEMQVLMKIPDEGTQVIDRLFNGAMFGELALLHVNFSSITVQAITHTRLWSIDRVTYRTLLLNHSVKLRDKKRQLLAGISFFKNFTWAEICKLADALTPHTFAKGTWLFKEKSLSDGMYIVDRGMVLMYVIGEYGNQVIVGRSINGQTCGEAALISYSQRRYSAVATHKARTYFIDVEDFERLVGSCLKILKRTKYDYDQTVVRICGTRNLVTDLRIQPKTKSKSEQEVRTELHE